MDAIAILIARAFLILLSAFPALALLDYPRKQE